MSEKMYTRLFRLYPPRFREEFEGEALQLIRDRLRDETGFLRRTRLCWDLIADLLAGLPRAHLNSYTMLEAAALSSHAGGIPSFKILDEEPLRCGSILVAGAVSLAAIAAFGFVLSRPITYPLLSGSNRQMSAIESVLERLNSATTPDAVVSSVQEAARPASAIASGQRPQPRPAATASTSKLQPPASLPQSKSALGAHDHLVRLRAQNPKEHSASLMGVPQSTVSQRDAVASAAQRSNIDGAERQRVVNAAVADLRQYYFDRSVAEKTAEALLTHEKNGDDNAATQGAAFAALLTAQMRDVSSDMHLVVEYSQNPLPSGPPVQTPEVTARFRDAMLRQHCMIRMAEILPHNIGYLKLDFFPDESVCGAEIREAMASLNHADAIIFDLRDNSGGFPDTVSLVASYLFDHPVYMYDPREAPTVGSWTRSPVAGNNLADKPAYVLTSGTTWSGAEQFSYDLKMLKRATLVGETTRGGAHAGVFHRIDDHFGMGIPEERPINPYGKTDWEGVGVTPEVRVKVADALETAVRLAEARIEKR